MSCNDVKKPRMLEQVFPIISKEKVEAVRVNILYIESTIRMHSPYSLQHYIS